MRVKGTSVQQLLLGLALLAALCWNLAHASEINDLRIAQGATGTRAELGMDHESGYKLISLANPDRLVVDLADASLGRSFRLPAATGLIKSVRSGHPQPGTTRIVFDLATPVVALKPHFEANANGSTRLVVEWPGDTGDDPIARMATGTAASANSASSVADNPAANQLAANSPAANPKTSSSATSIPPTSREVDPARASAAATSRLIANSAAPSTSPQSQVAGAGVATPGASALVTSPPGTIATGVPTRIATGVPAAVAGRAAINGDDDGNDNGHGASDVDDGNQVAARIAAQSMVRRGMRPLIVAIDPGHGGQDPGAIGMNGKREKDVTLAIGRELARQINATPGLKAYMTRDTDVFIPLNRRAQLARAAKADIFVSIHADASENRSASGSSVYVLSLKGASSQRARWLADKENAADLIGGRMPAADNTLASVLLDLTQSGHMKASEDAAGHVLDGLGRVGGHHKPRIERANFAVLRTSDMPSMLVETAFISNPEEERRLTDPSQQRMMAGAVLDGIDAYFLQQPPPGTLYAARADAALGRGGVAGSGGGGGR